MWPTVLQVTGIAIEVLGAVIAAAPGIMTKQRARRLERQSRNFMTQQQTGTVPQRYPGEDDIDFAARVNPMVREQIKGGQIQGFGLAIVALGLVLQLLGTAWPH